MKSRAKRKKYHILKKRSPYWRRRKNLSKQLNIKIGQYSQSHQRLFFLKHPLLKIALLSIKIDLKLWKKIFFELVSKSYSQENESDKRIMIEVENLQRRLINLEDRLSESQQKQKLCTNWKQIKSSVRQKSEEITTFRIKRNCIFCAVSVQISIKISSRRYAEEEIWGLRRCTARQLIKGREVFCSFLFAHLPFGGLNHQFVHEDRGKSYVCAKIKTSSALKDKFSFLLVQCYDV